MITIIITAISTSPTQPIPTPAFTLPPFLLGTLDAFSLPFAGQLLLPPYLRLDRVLYQCFLLFGAYAFHIWREDGDAVGIGGLLVGLFRFVVL